MPDLWVLLWFLAGVACCGVVVEAVSEILVASVLLDVIGLRPWVSRRALPADPERLKDVWWYDTFLYKLLTCGYCSSVWVALGVAWLVPGGYFEVSFTGNIVLKVFLVHRVSNYIHTRFELTRRGRVTVGDAAVKLTVAYDRPDAPARPDAGGDDAQ